MHRNPNVWEPVHAALAGLPGITLLPPVDYRSLVYLMGRCKLILTDSGGIQEEAPSLHVPVLVLRETTERPEAVAAGASRVVGTIPARIVAAVRELLTDAALYARMASAANPYGDGQPRSASSRHCWGANGKHEQGAGGSNQRVIGH